MDESGLESCCLNYKVLIGARGDGVTHYTEPAVSKGGGRAGSTQHSSETGLGSHPSLAPHSLGTLIL